MTEPALVARRRLYEVIARDNQREFVRRVMHPEMYYSGAALARIEADRYAHARFEYRKWIGGWAP